jgi:hypothetical protein
MKIIKLLLEAETKIDILRKSILNRLPLTIYYASESNEVLDGERINIYPVIMGLNKKNNRVIWAYVKEGVSKKGLPNWKMFREDRIQTAKINSTLPQFSLSQIPEYEMGKAPNAIKSLNTIEVYSPYWEEGKWKQGLPKKVEKEREKQQQQISVEKPKEIEPELQPKPDEEPVVKPEIKDVDYSKDALNTVKQKIVNKVIPKLDYENAIEFIYRKKENDWKEYQKLISGNVRPGEGTRNRFRNDAKNEFDNILKQNYINVEDVLSEIYKKFKHLIK